MGAPSSSGTIRPANKYSNTEGPGRFKGQTQHLTESSGEIRSTNESEIRRNRRARQAPEIAPDLKDSWRTTGKENFKKPL